MTLRVPLVWKLIALHTLILLCVLVAMWLAIDHLAADTFMTLMEKYDIDPVEVKEMFYASTHQTLWQVGLVALIVAALLCYALTRRLLAPLGPMIDASRRIADGDYTVRVEHAAGDDELGRLARDFDRMAQSLQHMEALRRRMVVDVAHELRTPLTNLRGIVEALQDGLLKPDDRTLHSLHEELLRLVRLTEDLCSAARADAAFGRIELVDHDLRGVIEDALSLFRPRVGQRGIELREDLDALPASVRLAPDAVHQILGNLLQNALQFTPAGGWIKVSGVRRAQVVRVVVANSGEGIPDQDLPWIFEPYYRADPSRSRHTGGAGIGLAIVKSLVEAHGGTVGASSTAEATRVWFELPTARAPVAARQVAARRIPG